MSWIDRQKIGALAAYRNGTARRTVAYRPAPAITSSASPQHHDTQPMIAFLEVREPLGDNTYRLGHLPTADEQIMDRDDS